MTTCHFCATELDYRHIDGNHWDGERYIRVAICDGCFGARKLAKAPRKPRAPRQPRTINMASDWNMLVAMTRKSH